MPEEIKPDPKAEARRLAAEAKQKQETEFARLSAFVGKSFSNGHQDATIVAFERNHLVRGLGYAPAFLINHGNPHRSDYHGAVNFLNEYKPKE